VGGAPPHACASAAWNYGDSHRINSNTADSALIPAPALLSTCEAWIPGSASPPRNDENHGEPVIITTLRDYRNHPTLRHSGAAQRNRPSDPCLNGQAQCWCRTATNPIGGTIRKYGDSYQINSNNPDSALNYLKTLGKSKRSSSLPAAGA
jgi:hypothetical protein